MRHRTVIGNVQGLGVESGFDSKTTAQYLKPYLPSPVGGLLGASGGLLGASGGLLGASGGLLGASGGLLNASGGLLDASGGLLGASGGLLGASGGLLDAYLLPRRTQDLLERLVFGQTCGSSNLDTMLVALTKGKTLNLTQFKQMMSTYHIKDDAGVLEHLFQVYLPPRGERSGLLCGL
eukprot:937995-Prorocentrum_minimum.AAC.2